MYGEADMPESIQTICHDLRVDVKKIESDFSFSIIGDNFQWRGINAQGGIVTLKTKKSFTAAAECGLCFAGVSEFEFVG